MKHINKKIIAYALIAVMLLGAAGCSAARNAGDEVRPHNAAVEEAVSPEVRTVNLEDSTGYYPASADTAGAYSEAATNAAQNSQGSLGTGTGTSDPGTISQSAVPSERMLIRNVSVQCETLHFAELTANLESQVAALGGYIESKNFSGTGNAGDLRSAYYTIRVSSESLDQLIGTIGDTAVIIGSSESTEDVTLTYTDMQARVESLRIEQQTLNDLLAQADDLDIILQLQNELTYVRYEIESYESQLRVLENLSSYSTLTLNISEVLEETEVEEPHVKTYSERFHEAFQDGLDEAKEKCEELGLYIAENAIGLAIKLVVLIVIIVVIVVNVKKRKNKSKAKKAMAPVAAPVTPVTPAPAAPESTEAKSDDKENK